MFAFMMRPRVAEEFWRRVIERKADTEKERAVILFEMAEEGLMNSVSATNRSKDEYIQDLSKEFRVLNVTSKKTDSGK